MEIRADGGEYSMEINDPQWDLLPNGTYSIPFRKDGKASRPNQAGGILLHPVPPELYRGSECFSIRSGTAFQRRDS